MPFLFKELLLKYIILQNEKNSLILGCVVPQVEVTFIMPSPTPGKESSGGDAESVLPDSASLGDDLHTNRKIFLVFRLFSVLIFSNT